MGPPSLSLLSPGVRVHALACVCVCTHASPETLPRVESRILDVSTAATTTGPDAHPLCATSSVFSYLPTYIPTPLRLPLRLPFSSRFLPFCSTAIHFLFLFFFFFFFPLIDFPPPSPPFSSRERSPQALWPRNYYRLTVDPASAARFCSLASRSLYPDDFFSPRSAPRTSVVGRCKAGRSLRQRIDKDMIDVSSWWDERIRWRFAPSRKRRGLRRRNVLRAHITRVPAGLWKLIFPVPPRCPDDTRAYYYGSVCARADRIMAIKITRKREKDCKISYL